VKELTFDKSMIEEAQEWADNLGAIKNSITKGKGNYVGRLGELALAKHIGAGEAQDQSGYDLIFNGKKIEVKTKRRAVPPRENYIVNLAKTSRHQRPDIYAFLSAQFESQKSGQYKNLEKLWLCGYKSSEDYFNESTFYAKGDIDPGWKPTPQRKHYRFSADCYVMNISDLDGVI
tara:strand:+ start:775 stop:1299 length:525 start_codon:yes stop_codon:yes gene_type:complete